MAQPGSKVRLSSLIISITTKMIKPTIMVVVVVMISYEALTLCQAFILHNNLLREILSSLPFYR